MNETCVYRLAEDVAFRTVEDEGVLVSPSKGEVTGVNQLGCEVLGRLDGATALSAIVDALCEMYEVERAQVMGDIEQFIGELVKAEFVCEVPSGIR